MAPWGPGWHRAATGVNTEDAPSPGVTRPAVAPQDGLWGRTADR